MLLITIITIIIKIKYNFKKKIALLAKFMYPKTVIINNRIMDIFIINIFRNHLLFGYLRSKGTDAAKISTTLFFETLD